VTVLHHSSLKSTRSRQTDFPPTLPSPARGEGFEIPSPGGRGKGEGEDDFRSHARIFMRLTVPGLSVFILIVLTAFSGVHAFELPSAEEMVSRVQGVYSRYCCFQAHFNQLTVNVAMDMTDRFEGTLFVKRPGMLALDVESPEKQRAVVRGRSYTVHFADDGNSVRGEVPAELNVDHFFNFFSDISGISQKFDVSFPSKAFSQEEQLVFLELKDTKHPTSTYRIVLGIDYKDNTIRRAIIYDALGNYNRFDLSKIVLVKSLPDSLFELGSGLPEAKSDIEIPFFDD